MNVTIRGAAAALAFTVAADGALAQSTGESTDNVFKAGVTYYDPHSKSNGVSGIGVPPGADVEVEGAATLLLTYERMFLPNVGVELVIGIPPKIKAKATGSVSFLGTVLEARNVAPTLFVNYHFGQPGDAFRPYLGLGVNYTKFTHVKSSLASDVDVGSSWGLAGAAGLDWNFSRNFGLFASVARIDVESKVVASGATVLKTKIDYRPWAYSAGVSYRF